MRLASGVPSSLPSQCVGAGVQQPVAGGAALQAALTDFWHRIYVDDTWTAKRDSSRPPDTATANESGKAKAAPAALGCQASKPSPAACSTSKEPTSPQSSRQRRASHRSSSSRHLHSFIHSLNPSPVPPPLSLCNSPAATLPSRRKSSCHDAAAARIMAARHTRVHLPAPPPHR